MKVVLTLYTTCAKGILSHPILASPLAARAYYIFARTPHDILVLGMQLTRIERSDWCATIVALAQVEYGVDTRSFPSPVPKKRMVKDRRRQTNHIHQYRQFIKQCTFAGDDDLIQEAEMCLSET